ncbi:murein biosynthesis integral membrane protein MurJ, partial [Neisseria sp. P0001.S004]
LWLAQYYLPFEWVHVGGFKKAGQLCVLIALGGGLYFVSLAALGFRPHHFRRVEK